MKTLTPTLFHCQLFDLVPYFAPEQRTPDVPTQPDLQDVAETRDQ